MEKIKISKAVHERNSAEIVASIDDLLKDILLRLPIKSLLRFESVCKHWQSLITNPRFCHLRNRTIGLMFPRKTNILKAGHFHEYVPFFETALNKKLGYYKDADFTMVTQSCNGLLLCFSYCIKLGSCIIKNVRYFVCNPSYNRLFLVPLLEEEDDNWYKSEMSLAFDPAISPHYKVVCVRISAKNLAQIFIYSSVTNDWEVCGDPFMSSLGSFSDGVYWNGAVHWMECKRHLYFKIEDHVLHEMPKLPFSNWTYAYYFGESYDHLHFVETLDTHQLNVYEIKRDYSEWFIKYRVDLSPVVAAYPEMIHTFEHPIMGLQCYNYSVCCIVRDEEKEKGEEESLVLQIPEKVIQLGLNHKTFRILQELEGCDDYCQLDLHECQGKLRYRYTNGYQYIESLCKI